jgi:hypothetical protein
MNKSAAAEVKKLRRIAAYRYHLDGGTMFECTTIDGYYILIRDHGTAEAAWEAELKLVDLRSECIEY